MSTKSKNASRLPPITDMDVGKLMLGLESLKQCQKLMGKNNFDMESYEQIHNTVSHLYDDISTRCLKAQHLLECLKEFLPGFEEYK